MVEWQSLPTPLMKVDAKEALISIWLPPCKAAVGAAAESAQAGHPNWGMLVGSFSKAGACWESNQHAVACKASVISHMHEMRYA